MQGISTEEAEEKLLTILKQVMEEKLTATNIEVGESFSHCCERGFLFVFFPVQMASVLVGGKYDVYDKTRLEAIIQRLRA